MNTTPVSPIPRARKEPRQQRSQMTVASIVEAARQILYAKGAEAVTARAVAMRAGVAIGSLYQYFPNRDAIMARLVEEEIERVSNEAQSFFTSVRDRPLPEFFALVLGRIIAVEKRMLDFGGHFHRRYTQHLDTINRRESQSLNSDAMTGLTAKLLEDHAAEARPQDMDLAATLLTRGLPLMVKALVSERPELVDNPHLLPLMGRIACLIAGYLPYEPNASGGGKVCDCPMAAFHQRNLPPR